MELQDRSQEALYQIMMARYYSSSLARFMAVDPSSESLVIEDPQAWNRYSYARNCPINRLDPDGRTDIYIGGFTDSSTRGVVGTYHQEQAGQAGRTTAYFEWSDVKGATDFANAHVGNGEPLNIIGHSYGASSAVIVASGVMGTVNTLVGADPVPLPGPLGMVGRPENVQTVVTVDAQMAVGDWNLSDAVEFAGVCVADVPAAPTYSSADQTIAVQAHHEDFTTQMTAPGSDGRSAQQIVDSTYEH